MRPRITIYEDHNRSNGAPLATSHAFVGELVIFPRRVEKFLPGKERQTMLKEIFAYSPYRLDTGSNLGSWNQWGLISIATPEDGTTR